MYMLAYVSTFDAREALGVDPDGAANALRELCDKYGVTIEPLYTARELESLKQEFQEAAREETASYLWLKPAAGMTMDKLQEFQTALLASGAVNRLQPLDKKPSITPSALDSSRRLQTLDW